MLDTLVRPARRAAYQAQQASFRLSLVAAHTVLRAVAGDRETPETDAFEALREQYEGLLERDVRNAEEGLYPASLLFQMPLLEYAFAFPRFLLDVPRSFLRARRGECSDLPEEANPRSYPAYFRRNFHGQTDGYLCRRSAEIYDVSVEFLFMGCADVMRRQVIPPMTRFARQQRRRPLRVLDVACGTGRTLSQLAKALPDSQLFGVDLSPYYLEAARERLAGVEGVSLVSENAEKLPYRDGYFDIVTSTYLFHELPRKARRQVLSEMNRVLRPGGLIVVEDSAQLEEATDLTPFFEGFATQMHEPFYRDYLRDDLGALVSSSGFSVEGTERAWLSKVVTARKPSRNGRG